MLRGIAQAEAPGQAIQALKDENKFLSDAVKFGVDAAEDLRQARQVVFSGGMGRDEAIALIDQNRQFKEILKSRKELNRISKTKENDGNTLEQS